MNDFNLSDGLALRWHFDGDTYTLHVKQGDAYGEPPRTWMDGSGFRPDIIGLWRDGRPYYVEEYDNLTPDDWLRNIILDHFPEKSEDAYDLSMPEMIDRISESAFVVPIWYNDHCSLSLACSELNPFYRWDSGQCGWYIRFDRCEDEPEIAKSEIQGLEDYFNGAIFCYDLYCDSCDDVIDRSFGFIGYDLIQNGMAEHVGCGLLDAIHSGKIEVGRATRVYSYEFKF